MISLILFYNISGLLLCILSLIMFILPEQKDDEGRYFNLSKRCLAFLTLLTGASMFVAQLEERLPEEQFEKLSACMLLFFFLIGQGILFSLLTLYASPHATPNHLRRVLLPVLPWFGIYLLIYFFTGDVRVYSLGEFLDRLPHEPLLILRCVILLTMTASILHSIRLCHRAKSEYHRLILCYFSETDFSRSVWLANLLGCAEALSIWVVLTYFYTNPLLEIIVGILITLLFAFYVKEFYCYGKRYGQLRPAILLTGAGGMAPDGGEKEESPVFVSDTEPAKRVPGNNPCSILLEAWVNRPDKPFTKPGITIGDVSADTGIPKYRLSGHINQEQDNFNAWIKILHIEEACRLLRECPTLSALEIAERTGFCDLPAFSRAFKKVKGVTPKGFGEDVELLLFPIFFCIFGRTHTKLFDKSRPEIRL